MRRRADVPPMVEYSSRTGDMRASLMNDNAPPLRPPRAEPTFADVHPSRLMGDFPGEPAVAIATWFFAWWALWRLIWDRQLGPYVLALIIASNVRILPPMGQVPPLPDPILLFVWPLSLPISFLTAAACLLSLCFGGSGDWRWWLGSSICAALGSYRRTDTRQQILSEFGAQIELVMSFAPTPPERPWPSKLHGYLFCLYSKVEGRSSQEHIHIKRIKPVTCMSTVDIWMQEGVKPANLPVFFFCHGGGWKGGGAKMNPQTALMQILASRGWFVVSAEYRKKQWPQQYEDTMDAFRWIFSGEARQMGADPTRIVVSGASAGGHIASLVIKQALSEDIFIAGCLLFYPALDPGDITGVTATSPCTVQALRIRAGQSLLHWFFETVILGRDPSLWSSATVLADLHSKSPIARDWPTTMVLHGGRDSVVPLEHSLNFLSLLAAAESDGTTTASIGKRPCDSLVIIPGSRHTFDLLACEEVQTVYEGAAAWLQDLLTKLPQPDLPQEPRNPSRSCDNQPRRDKPRQGRSLGGEPERDRPADSKSGQTSCFGSDC